MLHGSLTMLLGWRVPWQFIAHEFQTELSNADALFGSFVCNHFWCGLRRNFSQNFGIRSLQLGRAVSPKRDGLPIDRHDRLTTGLVKTVLRYRFTTCHSEHPICQYSY